MANRVEGWIRTLVCPCTGVCVCVCVTGIGRTVTTDVTWPQSIREISTDGQRQPVIKGFLPVFSAEITEEGKGVNEEKL